MQLKAICVCKILELKFLLYECELFFHRWINKIDTVFQSPSFIHFLILFTCSLIKADTFYALHPWFYI